ncbi:hypothetical protein CON45_31180, partial [Priestia megaterium]
SRGLGCGDSGLSELEGGGFGGHGLSGGGVLIFGHREVSSSIGGQAALPEVSGAAVHVPWMPGKH